MSSPQEAEVDLTCSRLQSELYRTYGLPDDRSFLDEYPVPLVSGAYQALRLCSFLSSPTISTVTSGVSKVAVSPRRVLILEF